MILWKRFLILVGLVSMFTGGAVMAQSVSDSDFMSINPPSLNIKADDGDTTFSIAVHVNNKTAIAAFTIPLSLNGHPNLLVDTSVVTGGNKGITYATLGQNAIWVQKTSLVKNNDTAFVGNDTIPPPSILIGFISFSTGLPPSNDDLVNIHLKVTNNSQTASVTVDSTVLPPANHLTVDDELANTYIPQWTPCVLNINGTAVGDEPVVQPLSYGLDQNFPNPFNAGTKISFSLAAPGKVDLKVYNLLGQSVKTLVSSELPGGPHNIVWNGTNDDGEGVGSGTYFYRLKVGDVYEETRQMTLLK